MTADIMGKESPEDGGMRTVKVISRVYLLFFVVAMIGLALLLTGCFTLRYAAYTPTPTKTPRSSETALPVTPPFDRPTIILFPSPRGAIARSTGVPAVPSETDTTTSEPPIVTPAVTPMATHIPTATETFTPLPTPKPGEPTYTPTLMPTVTPTLMDTPTSTPTPKATDTLTPVPTSQPGEPTYTPTSTPTVTPPATDTPTSTPMPTATDTALPTPTFTATPTETPRPAETPTPEMPTITPTVVPTPVVSGGWNLSHFYLYVVYELGELHVLGVLENATGQNRESPNAIFTFRDEVGEVMATDSCPLELTGVPAGWRSPFHLVTPVEKGFASGDISVESTISRDPLRTDLVVDDVQVFLEGDIYVVTGNITNPGASLETYAEVAVALLDEVGQTIGVGSELLGKEGLGSGQTVPFRIEVDEFLGTANGYDIVAVGL